MACLQRQPILQAKFPFRIAAATLKWPARLRPLSATLAVCLTTCASTAVRFQPRKLPRFTTRNDRKAARVAFCGARCRFRGTHREATKGSNRTHRASSGERLLATPFRLQHGDDGARANRRESLDDPLDPNFRTRPRHDLLLRTPIRRPLRQSRHRTPAVVRDADRGCFRSHFLRKIDGELIPGTLAVGTRDHSSFIKSS